jgi:hypothetical protein
MENHGFGHQADVIIGEALHRDLQLNPPQFEKGGHCKKTESRREA